LGQEKDKARDISTSKTRFY